MSKKAFFLPNVWSFCRNALHLRCRTCRGSVSVRAADILQDEQDILSVLVNLENLHWHHASPEIRKEIVWQVVYPSPEGHGPLYCISDFRHFPEPTKTNIVERLCPFFLSVTCKMVS